MNTLSDQAAVALAIFAAGLVLGIGRWAVSVAEKQAVTAFRLDEHQSRIDRHESSIKDHSAAIAAIEGTLRAIHESIEWIREKLGGKG